MRTRPRSWQPGRARAVAPAAIALVAGTLACVPAGGAAQALSMGADGEPSRTPASAPPHLLLPPLPEAAIARLDYRELPLTRLLELYRDNRERGQDARKPSRIGIARVAAREAGQSALPALRWLPVVRGDGVAGSAAQLHVSSPLAMALRVGLRLQGLPDGAQLRFAGSELPADPPVLLDAAHIKAATLADGLFWTPLTDGQGQTIEIFVPGNAVPHALRVDAPQLSHLVANTRSDLQLVPMIGESGACNIDVACEAGALGAGFVHAKDAVARMTFVEDGQTWTCTGTLLNDTVPGTQVPWFYTAHHCISSHPLAATVNTHWHYEATACNSGTSRPRILLAAGADYLYSHAGSDGALLRLRDPAPATATFAGWDARPLANGTTLYTIHHPAGDAKKVSTGRKQRQDTTGHRVNWTRGTTEGGSSGAGLFTADGNGFRLRGGLQGGNASCATSGNTNHPDNYDWYSRLDVIFPQLRRYLAPQPARDSGGEPLLPRR